MMKSPVALVVGLLVAAPAWGQEINAISKVDVQGDGQKATILVVGSRRPTFQAYTQKAPARVVVDFVKSSVNMPLSTPRPAGQLVTEIRATQMGTAGRELARLEFVFADEIDYTVDADGNALKLTVTRHARPNGAVAGDNGAVVNAPARPGPVASETSTVDSARVAAEKAAADKLDADKAAKEKAEREKADLARLDAERKAETARLDAEKARVEAEMKAEEARVEAEKARVARETAIRQEQERQARDAAEKAEKARVEQERVERERVAREAAEKARVETERKERERLDREKAEAARVEAERVERARVEREKAEKAERVAAEAARAEKARVEREAAEKATRAEKERADHQRAEQEKAAQAEKTEKARRAEDERLAQLKADVAAAELRKTEAAPVASGNRHAGSAADAPAARGRDEDDGFGGKPVNTPAPVQKPAPAPVAGHAGPGEASHAEEGGGGGGGGPRVMTFVGFKNNGEQSQVVVRTNEKVTFNVRKVGQNKVAIELDNTRILLRNNQRSLDTSFFPRTAVKTINPEETSGSTKGVKIIIELSEEVPFESKQEGNIITVSFQRPAG